MFLSCEVLPASQLPSAFLRVAGLAAGRSGRLVRAADWRPGRQRYHTTLAHFASTRYCRASSRCHVWPTHDAMRPPAQAKDIGCATVQHVSLACATVFRGMKSGQFTARCCYSSTAALRKDTGTPRHKFVLQMKTTSPECKSAAAQDSMIQPSSRRHGTAGATIEVSHVDSGGPL